MKKQHEIAIWIQKQQEETLASKILSDCIACQSSPLSFDMSEMVRKRMHRQRGKRDELEEGRKDVRRSEDTKVNTAQSRLELNMHVCYQHSATYCNVRWIITRREKIRHKDQEVIPSNRDEVPGDQDILMYYSCMPCS